MWELDLSGASYAVMSNKGLKTKTDPLNWISYHLTEKGSQNYSYKMSSRSTRTNRSAIWPYFASITPLRLVMITIFPWIVFTETIFYWIWPYVLHDLWWQYIKVRQLFKGGNYSRAESIHGNTVIFFRFHESHQN